MCLVVVWHNENGHFSMSATQDGRERRQVDAKKKNKDREPVAGWVEINCRGLLQSVGDVCTRCWDGYNARS